MENRQQNISAHNNFSSSAFTPNQSANKMLMITPSIAMFEHLIKEYKSILNDTHPKLISERKRLDAIIQEKMKNIENYQNYQEKLIYKQLQCEIQNAYDESNDIVFSNNQQSV